MAAGEMGIGNTTSASCLAVLLAGVPLDRAVGRGAGADDASLERKRRVVEQAAARAARSLTENARGAIAEVSGFEIVAMAGFFLEARRLGLTIVLDGMIATAAALDRRDTGARHRRCHDRGPPFRRARPRAHARKARPRAALDRLAALPG